MRSKVTHRRDQVLRQNEDPLVLGVHGKRADLAAVPGEGERSLDRLNLTDAEHAQPMTFQPDSSAKSSKQRGQTHS